MEAVLSIALGGHALDVTVHDPRLVGFFADFKTDLPAEAAVCVSAEDCRRAAALYPEDTDPAYVEGDQLQYRIAGTLLRFGCAIFHGTAFVWRGKVYIFAAPSGTGKTTQYVLWKLLYGDEITLLNGDKPVLESREEGILVHPSPWRGKEGMQNLITAPLGGIILLRQAKENFIRKLAVKESLQPLFYQFIRDARQEDDAELICDILEQLLRSVPVWQLDNRGDRESARLAHDTLLRSQEEMS